MATSAELATELREGFDGLLAHVEALGSIGHMSGNQAIEGLLSVTVKQINIMNHMQALVLSHEREIKELKEQSAVYLDLLHKKFVEGK